MGPIRVVSWLGKAGGVTLIPPFRRNVGSVLDEGGLVGDPQPSCSGQPKRHAGSMTGRAIILRASASLMLSAAVSCAGTTRPAPRDSSKTTPTAVPAMADRVSRIPAQAVKISPETDLHPPSVHSKEFEQPVPVPGPVNTAGAEDSPFITPDGNTLYFFFTPDVDLPVQQQIQDGVTGIYVTHKEDGEWSKPTRVVLQDPGKLAGDGCEFVQGDVMWFCSVREGFTGVHWFKVEYRNGLWQNWQLADFDPNYQVGEFHISADDSELFFGSDQPGGSGGLDIWVSEAMGGVWQQPTNISSVNTIDNEGWPALNPAGDELWFTRNNAVWRSRRAGDGWTRPELVVSPLAGEPSIDGEGNLYFVHHFYKDDSMIEADIYVAHRK